MKAVAVLLSTGLIVYGAARPETPDAALRWLTVPEARALVGDNNLRYTLDRAAKLLS